MSVVALIVTPLDPALPGWTYHVFRARLGAVEEPPPVELVPRETGA
jgi:hypothetical protein